MIKNSAARVLGCFGRFRGGLGLAAVFAGTAGLVLSGCEVVAKTAQEPAPLQGVVEHDDRAIGFELGGRVLSVDVQRGQTVPAGALVAKLDDSLERPVRELRAAELQAAEAQLALLEAGTRSEELRAAEAEIAALRSQEAIARKNLARQEGLRVQGALAQSVVDETSAVVDSTVERKRALEEKLKALRKGARAEEIDGARARVTAARAALESVDTRLARYTLRTLIAGDVIDTHVEAGEMVAPGALAITLADLAHPYVDVFVPQAEVHAVQVGEKATTRIDGVATPFASTVEHVFAKTEFTPRFLFSEGERSNLVMRVRVRVDDPKRQLHAGVPAFVRLEEGSTP